MNKKTKIFIVIFLLLVCNCTQAQTDIVTQSVDSISVAQLIENTHAINENTDAWHGVSNVVVSILALLSSIFSIIAGVFAFGIWRERRVSKKLQIAIIDDLIRHFFVNKSILLRVKKEIEKEQDVKLTFRKMAVLQDDLNMNRFTIYPRYYQCVHEIEFQARNYNMYCEWAADNFIHLSNNERVACIDNLISRADRLSNYLDMLKRVIVDSHIRDFFADITNPEYKSENEVIIKAFAHNYTNAMDNKDRQEMVNMILEDLTNEKINYLDLKQQF